MSSESVSVVFKCTECGEVYYQPVVTCSSCGGLVLASYPGKPDPTRVDYSMPGIWFFKYSLPPLPRIISLGEGRTPLVKSTRLAKDRVVYFKDEGRNPTGSLRDRAASVVVSHAASLGLSKIVAASDGNMGVSLAAYAARAGIKAVVYAPSWIDGEKVLLMKAYGAQLVLEDKSIDALVKQALDLSRRKEYYNASSTLNPLSIEGLKTIAFEVAGELGGSTKAIYVPLGSGVTYLALYVGFKELVESGVISSIPKLVGVEHCGNPKYAEHLHGASKCREEALPGLRYYTPPLFNHVARVIERYGDVVVVSSREALRASKLLATREGLFTEVSSAVAVAGYLKHEEDHAVVVLFGHGIKSASAYAKPLRRRFTTPYIGVTKKLILEVVRSKPGLTGYEIWKELGLNITPQSVYQHLRELVELGLLRVAEEGGVKKYYLASQY